MKHLRPLGMLFAMVALFSAFQFGSVALATTNPDDAARLTSTGLSLAFVVWIMTDAQSRRRTPCYEFGFLVYMYFPISLAWYVFWLRGWRALFILAGFFVLMLLPSLSAVVASMIGHGLP